MSCIQFCTSPGNVAEPLYFMAIIIGRIIGRSSGDLFVFVFVFALYKGLLADFSSFDDHYMPQTVQ
jgi:hypothetical protein